MRHRVIRRICLLAALYALTLCGQTGTINGSFKNPDGSAFSGKIVVSFTQSTARVTCGSAQLVPMTVVVSKITNGTMAQMTLYATSCLSPAIPYRVMVYDKYNQLVYRGLWTVPTGSVNVSTLDSE